jgi:hypothetical protein
MIRALSLCTYRPYFIARIISYQQAAVTCNCNAYRPSMYFLFSQVSDKAG